MRLLSRNRLSLTTDYPRVADAIAALPIDQAILDGEATGAWGKQGAGRLPRLRRAVAERTRRDRAARWTSGARCCATHPVPAAACERVTPLDGDAPWERACREGWEGVIAKRRDSPYEHRRSKHWLKMKCEATQELVVGGFTDPQGSRVGLGALLVGYFEGDDFVFAGKVGTGFDTGCCSTCGRASTRSRSPTPPFTKGDRPAAPAHALGAAARSWCRSRSPSGRCTASCGIRGCSASASTSPRAQVDEGAPVTHATITHPEKVLFPDGRHHQGRARGVLRRDRAGHAAAPPPPADHDGALSRTASARKGFIQKDVSKGFPEWLKRVEAPKKGGTVHYPLANDTRSLLWLANQNASRLHVWTSRAPRLDRPDVCVFDLDPSRDEPEVLREAMLALRAVLDELGHRQLGEDVGLEGLPRRGADAGACDVRGCLRAGQSRRRHPGRAATRTR